MAPLVDQLWSMVTVIDDLLAIGILLNSIVVVQLLLFNQVTIRESEKKVISRKDLSIRPIRKAKLF